MQYTAAAVIFLRARHLGPNGGPDHEREQHMIALQRAACERSAKELGAHIIRLARQPHDRVRLTQEIHAAGVELVATDHPPTPWQLIQ
jgi:hypothetical protein